MASQQEYHAFKGMQRDLTVSKFSNEFYYDAKNIRITSREDNTFLSVANEKGNIEVEVRSSSIEGTIIGHTVLNEYLVLFTTELNVDRIYKLKYEDTYFDATLLYEGSIGLSIDHPIECIGIYENENIQKVYWVDGINPVRFINISKTYDGSRSDVFNFLQNLQLDEVVTITSNKELQGEFPSGTVQYVFTYYTKHGSESNIFHHSPLYYTHSNNRGGSPEEKASNSFNISITGLDKKFDFVRIYSIVRTSIDATPAVRKVVDLNVVKDEDKVTFTDNYTLGETIDPTILLYLGGENIIPECITHKDNTLFLGNYVLPQSVFPKEFKNINKGGITFEYKKTPNYEFRNGTYSYTSQLDMNSYEITTLKSNEIYRFGIQFQNRIGRWSEVIWVQDKKVDKTPSAEMPTSINNSISKYYNYLVKGVYEVPDNVLEQARQLGYIRARGVIVYPNNSDRDIICQGVLNPTVYKYDDRFNEDKTQKNSPYSQSSWFFRPYVKKHADFGRDQSPFFGSIATYTDSRSVNYSPYKNMEITRSTEIGTTLSYIDNDVLYNKDFYVDSNIVTMHSPDIEFQDNIFSIQNSDLKCKITGYININSCSSFRDVQASTPSATESDYGFYSKFPSYTYFSYLNVPYFGGGMLISGINWLGSPITKDEDTWKVVDRNMGWLVSPWQRSGSLINDFAKRANDQVVSKLKHNRLINTRVSYETIYTDINNEYEDISKVSVFDSEEQTLTYIGDTGLLYYGNIDKVLIPGIKTSDVAAEVGCTRKTTSNETRAVNEEDDDYNGDDPNDSTDNPTDNPELEGGGTGSTNKVASVSTLYQSTIFTLSSLNLDLDDAYKYSKDPVSMKYKSSKHAVFQFKNNDNSRVLLPAINDAYYPHSDDNTSMYSTIDVNHNAILWLAELYREIGEDVKFGGTTQDALLNNKWIVAGDPVCINKENVTVEYLQGDTYFQRYDCLKTYPYSLEDENNVTEVLSFYCETRVNIDGRYDRNRGSLNNLALSPNIFNLINPVYSQDNNFFNYHVLDSSFNIDKFPNSLTWSKEKYNGEEIDQWTNITLASTLEMDGDKGPITGLKTYNNEIYCFQPSGFSNILFNSRVQIPASDGVPIEITNGLKVQGKRYISSTIGCTNKWSIVNTVSGLYFMDNNTNSIYKFSGEISSITDSLGFSQWMRSNSNNKVWSPVSFENFISYYDKSNGDIYFTDNKQCLCYSEKINQFTSFMDYEGVYPMFNMNNDFYSFKNNRLWHHFEGEYNMFYGEHKPYYITVISNSNPTIDKIYNTLEFRSDSWDSNNLINDTTFNNLDVWNEYQHGSCYLDFSKYKVSNLKKKFRVWRANIPRDNSNNRDRIRNTWSYIKLSMDSANTWKTQLHDLNIHYFM